jgi:hypothetical protein
MEHIGPGVKIFCLRANLFISYTSADFRVEGPSPYGAILDKGEINDFDGQFVGWPNVLEVGAEYRMYYHTYDVRSKTYALGLATSPDGLRWRKKGPIFNAGGQGLFDEMGVSRRHVIRLSDGSYKMWYEGLARDGMHSIGLALSSDGIKWDRYGEEPIFSSQENNWDSGGVGSPHLVWLEDKKRWRLYYIGTRTIEGRLHTGIGVAESLDEEGIYFERVNTLNN